MGDIFDFLSEESKYFVKKNQIIIDKINELSKSCEVYYFEGNHDYNLSSLLTNSNIFSKTDQPQIFQVANKKIALLHGDSFVGIGYEIFSKIIRNRFLLKLLNFLDYNYLISKKIEKSLSNKKICYKFKIENDWILKRFKNITTDIVAEGHYHQNYQTSLTLFEYVNFPSLACTGEYSYFDGAKFQTIKL